MAGTQETTRPHRLRIYRLIYYPVVSAHCHGEERKYELNETIGWLGNSIENLISMAFLAVCAEKIFRLLSFFLSLQFRGFTTRSSSVHFQ